MVTPGPGYLFSTFLPNVTKHLSGELKPEWHYKQSLGSSKPSLVDYKAMQAQQADVMSNNPYPRHPSVPARIEVMRSCIV